MVARTSFRRLASLALFALLAASALACGGGSNASAGGSSPTNPSTAGGATASAAHLADAAPTQVLARTINLANALEAPEEGQWGLRLEESHFHAIKDAGFTAVRVPIQWSAHAGAFAPFTIDRLFFDRIDWLIRVASADGLAVILDFQNYNALTDELGAHRARFLAIWQQIAAHYARAAANVYFEPYNEPHDKLDATAWNALAKEVLGIIRAQNPNRWVVIGPTGWNAWTQVQTLALPENDKRIVVAFHFYEPMEFTHQGAEWMENSKQWIGKPWNGTPAELTELRKAFDAVSGWAKGSGRPVIVGEFGVIEQAPNTSRARWLRAVSCEARARGFAWGLWDFTTNFGAYERASGQWRREILDAVSDPPKDCPK